MDEDGMWYWYATKPFAMQSSDHGGDGFWFAQEMEVAPPEGTAWSSPQGKVCTVDNWLLSLERRPTEGDFHG